MHTSVASRNTMIDAFTALLNGGTLRIYDGSRPATPETAVSTQTLLATLTFGSPAFASASSASATANAITADTSADATGTAAWARALTSGGTAVADLTVSVTSGGGEIEFNSVAIQSGAQVSISLMTITQATGT